MARNYLFIWHNSQKKKKKRERRRRWRYFLRILMDFRNWDPGNRWGSGDYDRIGHLYSSGIKGIRKIHGDAKGKDQLLDLVEGFTTEEPYIKGSVWFEYRVTIIYDNIVSDLGFGHR